MIPARELSVYFPFFDSLKRLFVVNAPAIFTAAWSVIRLFLGKSSRSLPLRMQDMTFGVPKVATCTVRAQQALSSLWFAMQRSER